MKSRNLSQWTLDKLGFAITREGIWYHRPVSWSRQAKTTKLWCWPWKRVRLSAWNRYYGARLLDSKNRTEISDELGRLLSTQRKKWLEGEKQRFENQHTEMSCFGPPNNKKKTGS